LEADKLMKRRTIGLLEEPRPAKKNYAGGGEDSVAGEKNAKKEVRGLKEKKNRIRKGKKKGASTKLIWGMTGLKKGLQTKRGFG